ncbi:MAG: ATP-binding cassette domain-containing protein [Anaerococcus prevotii]|nr:ATP-binding cassette domain-containing protein [uncultured Anaerococcus sp.]MDU5149177.1 ATP-binding cassette domain-containing protein [Anaerococcus prevotii]
MARENTDNLSSGEMQKISVARAMYKDNYILILDEPFSALDKKSVDTILDVLLEDERSLVVIAHNLSKDMTLNFYKIIHMKKILNL